MVRKTTTRKVVRKRTTTRTKEGDWGWPFKKKAKKRKRKTYSSRTLTAFGAAQFRREGAKVRKLKGGGYKATWWE